ncbi:hypothetical protein ACM70I_12685 [Pseudomonas aeruginosa]|uniref:hypothetical protein n=2 Tax=Pseudomonas aeruginosa TaxID=287 RepID=UPI000A41A2EB|nr:hypothetical protein [Pseudomonas aeruginosa]MEA8424023.1 hypothetical protein [Pseudomonas aeruginosa]HCF0510585.1 hypothetical protein [Pseudomonas aeruginosa]HCF1989037.1 hypothetical protein [Pseudomonas aeruginosa]HCL4430713.1 hypothetical protein [Pseudomonas aeruginosa]
MFKRHVDDVHNAAKIVIQKQNATPVWPNLLSENTGEAEIRIEFAEPAILWNAPIRGSSSTASLAKRAIVMGGSFCFKEGTFDMGAACLEVYSITRLAGAYKLKLLEAMHFDTEPNAQQSPFHPMFHVQFGKNNHWDIAKLQARVAEVARIDANKIEIDRELTSFTRDMRIPTPQMDYLSMLVMVIADYFCEKNSTREVKTGFKKVLKKVMDSRNPARYGRQSNRLAQRWSNQAANPFCASHWYEESCS